MSIKKQSKWFITDSCYCAKPPLDISAGGGRAGRIPADDSEHRNQKDTIFENALHSLYGSTKRTQRRSAGFEKDCGGGACQLNTVSIEVKNNATANKTADVIFLHYTIPV